MARAPRAINGLRKPDRGGGDFSQLTGTTRQEWRGRGKGRRGWSRGRDRDCWRGFTRATAAVEFTRGTTAAAEGRERASEVDERAATLYPPSLLLPSSLRSRASSTSSSSSFSTFTGSYSRCSSSLSSSCSLPLVRY